MKFIDFLKRFDEPKYGGNRGVVPERGHAQPSALTDIIKNQQGFNYKFLPNEPHVRIEFDSIDNPTVWIDGNEVVSLETLDVNWTTDTDKQNAKRFEISYLDLNDPTGPFIKQGQTNQQSSRVNNKPDNVKVTIAIDSSQLVESIREFKQSLEHKLELPMVYVSNEKPTNPHIGDLWISSYPKYERGGIVVSASYKQWNGRKWTPYHD